MEKVDNEFYIHWVATKSLKTFSGKNYYVKRQENDRRNSWTKMNFLALPKTNESLEENVGNSYCA